MAEQVLPRPVSKPTAGPLDYQFWNIVEADFRRLVANHPIYATYLGIHDSDYKLDDATRDAIVQELADSHRNLRELVGIDPAGLSESVRLER